MNHSNNVEKFSSKKKRSHQENESYKNRSDKRNKPKRGRREEEF